MMNKLDLAVDTMQLILSSFILFCVLTLLTEFCLHTFKVNNARLRVYCRFMPLIKLPLCVVGCNVMHGYQFDLNIFSCESYWKPFIESLFLSKEQAEFTVTSQITLPKFLGMQLPMGFACTFLFFIGLISFGILCAKSIQFSAAIYCLNKICLRASIYQVPIQSQLLASAIKKTKVSILVTDEIMIPIAFGRRKIIFPRQLVTNYTQAEFESVIAHELEHLRWRDPLLKCASVFLGALFWWIPTRWWFKKIENEQEIACDASIERYGFFPEVFVKAVLKTISYGRQKNPYNHLLSHLIQSNNDSFIRIKLLMEEPIKRKGWKDFSAFGVAAVLFSFFVIGFRIC